MTCLATSTSVCYFPSLCYHFTADQSSWFWEAVVILQSCIKPFTKYQHTQNQTVQHYRCYSWLQLQSIWRNLPTCSFLFFFISSLFIQIKSTNLVGLILFSFAYLGATHCLVHPLIHLSASSEHLSVCLNPAFLLCIHLLDVYTMCFGNSFILLNLQALWFNFVFLCCPILPVP